MTAAVARPDGRGPLGRRGPKPGLTYRPGPRPAHPSVSVVVPVHGHQPFLAEQIEALASQSYGGWWEVLICDNGCDAYTLSLPGRHGAGLARLRVIDATGRPGACFARNRGVDEARGELILICDADDVVGAGWVENLVRAAATADLVGGHVDYGRLNTALSAAWRMPLTDGRLPTQLGFLPFAVGCNLAVWRDLYLAVGGCDEEVVGGRGGDDVDLSWRVQLAGGRLAFAPEAVVHYRLRSDLRSLVRQMYGYGQSSAVLYRNYRRYGARRRPAGEAVHFWLHVLRRGPGLARSPEAGGHKLTQVAYHLGEMRGALRYRVLFW